MYSSSSDDCSNCDKQENNLEPEQVEIDNFDAPIERCNADYIEEDMGQSPFVKLRSFLDNKNAKRMQKTIDINPAEILIMTLTLSLVHNLSLMAVCDVLKLVNFICCTSIFRVINIYIRSTVF